MVYAEESGGDVGRRFYSDAYEWNYAWTLKDYVHSLLKQGKKSTDSEFQILFKIYGRDKIVPMAMEYLEENKKK